MHAGPIRPTPKANLTNGRGWRYYGLALGIFCMLAVSARAQSRAQSSPTCTLTPQFNLSAYYGGQPVSINTSSTNTSQSPCAWADAVTEADELTVFLACPLTTTGPIALCYYAGVPGAPLKTPSCTLSQGGKAAECYCYQIDSSTGGSAAPAYSYVEITAILNQTVYNQAVTECGTYGNGGTNDNGKGCLNAADVQKGNPTGKTPAPVCAMLNKGTSGSAAMFPGADLISDFSPIGMAVPSLKIPAPLTTTYACSTSPSANLYAACMTAPCKNTNKIDPNTGLPLAKCTCPTFNGPNQVGNPQINTNMPPKLCNPTPYVWSAAYIE